MFDHDYSADPSAFSSNAYNPTAAQLLDQERAKEEIANNKSKMSLSGSSESDTGRVSCDDGRGQIRGLVLPDLVLDRY